MSSAPLEITSRSLSGKRISIRKVRATIRLYNGPTIEGDEMLCPKKELVKCAIATASLEYLLMYILK